MAIRVLVYEDNEQLRESITSLLQLGNGVDLQGAFADATNVLNEVRNFNPDVVLMDIDMPLITGIEAVRQLRSAGRTIPVIMLTVFDDSEHVFQAIKAGASGYLLKKHISSRIFQAIDEALNDGAPMSPGIARTVLSSMYQPAVANPYQLTSREQEILGSLSKGNSYKLIAAELSISLDTVRTHIKRVYEKLHVHSQTEAVSKAINEKLV